MAEKEKALKFPLRTVDQLNEAHEWLFGKQVNQEIDNKTADSLNTTLKGAVYLNAKLRLDAAKLLVQARIKKIDLPEGLLPTLSQITGPKV